MMGMFQIPFAHLKIRDWSFKKKEILELYKADKVVHKEEHIITDFHYNTKTGYNYSEDVYKILKEEIDSFTARLNLENYFVRNSWMEISKDDMDHKVHNHGALGFSCVCYVEYDSKIHKPTHFISPFGDYETGSLIYFIPPNIEEGSLIFFPSSVNHFTVPSRSEKERVILSFNLNKKKDYVYD
jgi:hypothetical protein